MRSRVKTIRCTRETFRHPPSEVYFGFEVICTRRVGSKGRISCQCGTACQTEGVQSLGVICTVVDQTKSLLIVLAVHYTSCTAFAAFATSGRVAQLIATGVSPVRSGLVISRAHASCADGSRLQPERFRETAHVRAFPPVIAKTNGRNASHPAKLAQPPPKHCYHGGQCTRVWYAG